MSILTYSLLDNQMNQDDKAFFKTLGEHVAKLRRELGITQSQLAKTLGISQQLIAAYEAGTRKIPASMLPKLAKLFAVTLESWWVWRSYLQSVVLPLFCNDKSNKLA